MASHSSVLAWGESHEQRSLVGYSPWTHRRVRHDLVTKQQQQQALVSPKFNDDKAYLGYSFIHCTEHSVGFSIWKLMSFSCGE